MSTGHSRKCHVFAAVEPRHTESDVTCKCEETLLVSLGGKLLILIRWARVHRERVNKNLEAGDFLVSNSSASGWKWNVQRIKKYETWNKKLHVTRWSWSIRSGSILIIARGERNPLRNTWLTFTMILIHTKREMRPCFLSSSNLQR